MYCKDLYVLTTRFKAKPGREEDLKEVLTRGVKGCSGQEGLLLYSLHQDREDRGVFMLYEHFTSEASFRLHIDSSVIRNAQDALVGIIETEPEITYWSILEKTGENKCR